MTNRTATEKPLTDEDFQALAAFRAALRQFVRFSEEAAREAGLTPQQHQALVAIRGHVGDEPPTVGELAEALQVKHHSAVGLVDRIVQRGFARRDPQPSTTVACTSQSRRPGTTCCDRSPPLTAKSIGSSPTSCAN